MAQYRFGECELDEDLFELRVRGAKVAAPPKVLKLLLLLVRERARAVTHREVLREVWADAKIERSALSRVVLEARRAIGDDRQEMIVTVRTHGFRFAAPVTEIDAAALPAARPSGPFVGREATMLALGVALDRALARRGGVAWITGEAGIGKTTVLDELAIGARARGMQVALVRCHDTEGTPPYWPWSQLVRALAAERPPAQADELSRAAAHLESGPRPEFRTFETVTRAIVGAATAQPIAILVDDLHWADEASLHLLRFFAREIHEARVFVAGAYRDSALEGDLRSRAFGALLSEYGSVLIPLHALTREDAARLVADLKGVEPTSQFVSALYERTGGSPRFLHQVLGTDWAKRALEDAARSLASSVDLQRGLLESISRHLDGLSASCRELLMHAAVLGKDFEFATLAAVAGLERAVLVDRLDEAVRQRVLLQTKVGRYRFVHPVMGEVLYKQLSASVRAARHRAVAVALEAAHADALDMHAAEIAHHFTRSAALGTEREAFEHSVRAARYAALRGDARAALRLWEQAAHALGVVGATDAQRVDTYLELGRARARAGDAAGARAALVDATTLARVLDRSDALAEATRELDGLARPPAET